MIEDSLEACHDMPPSLYRRVCIAIISPVLTDLQYKVRSEVSGNHGKTDTT